MILVAGGTGTLGTRVVRQFTGRGEAVRVLARDPGRAGQLPDTVELLPGDLRDPATLAAAVAGCTTVISAVHGFAGPGRPSPGSVDRDGNRALIQAAAAAGTEHLVLVSVLGAAPDHPMSLHRAKHAAEQALQASGLAWTIIRPSPFLETWAGIIGAKLGSNGQALVFGPGRIRHVPLPMLRAMSALARPVAPAVARQAQAAVVMNTTDMTADGAALRGRFPALPSTTLDELLKQQPLPT
jgi:uncharacterized protein YbjT (DUF2867 family)